MLSKKTKYGLKALSYLASQNNRQPVPIAEVAKHENISQKFLESFKGMVVPNLTFSRLNISRTGPRRYNSD